MPGTPPAGFWGALGEAGGVGQGSVGGNEGYSLGFAGGPGFVGADDEEREKDGKEATAAREKYNKIK